MPRNASLRVCIQGHNDSRSNSTRSNSKRIGRLPSVLSKIPGRLYTTSMDNKRGEPPHEFMPVSIASTSSSQLPSAPKYLTSQRLDAQLDRMAPKIAIVYVRHFRSSRMANWSLSMPIGILLTTNCCNHKNPTINGSSTAANVQFATVLPVRPHWQACSGREAGYRSCWRHC